MSHVRIIVFLLFAGLFPLSQLSAQTSRIESDSNCVRTFSEFEFSPSDKHLTRIINYSLDSFHVIHPRDISTGNLGGPRKSLDVCYSFESGFRDRRSFNGNFHFGAHCPPFYYSLKPITVVQYGAGMRKEQFVDVLHARNFGNNLGTAFGFRRIRSEGFYRNQQTNTTSLFLNSWFRGKHRRYAMHLHGDWTTSTWQENGGIVNDSLFEFATQLDRKLVGVNLANAQGRLISGKLQLTNYWSLGPDKFPIADTTDPRKVIVPKISLGHQVTVRGTKRVYNDFFPVDGYFETIYSDSLETRDSTRLNIISNDVFLQRNFRSLTKVFFMRIAAGHEAIDYHNDTIKITGFNIPGKLEIFGRDTSSWLTSYHVKCRYYFSGLNENNYQVSARVGFLESNRVALFVSALSGRYRPEQTALVYSGNHFKWVNDLSDEFHTQFELQTRFRFNDNVRIGLGAEYNSYSNYIFYDSTLLPQQQNGTFNVLTLSLRQQFQLAHFKWYGSLRYNLVSAVDPIRLPPVIARQTFIGEWQLFKAAITFQVGCDLTYIGSYYADGYHTNLSVFYVQDAIKLKSYMYFDPFVAIQIKSVRAYIRAEHVNAGLMGRTYYMIPHYPGNDLALKLGLSWIFND
jgi:hypothetical protein